MSRLSPPPLARVILRAAIGPGRDRETILADLDEELVERVVRRAGGATASRWYWDQVLRSLAPLLIERLRVAASVELATRTLRAALAFLAVFAVSIATTVGVSRVVSVPTAMRLGCYLAALFAAATAGSWIASRSRAPLRRSASLGMALFATLFVAASLALSPERQPAVAWIVWGLTALFGCRAGAAVGGWSPRLRRLLTIGLLLGVPTTSRAQTIDYEPVRVADGVVAFLSSERGVGNAVAVIGPRGVLVVDASTPSGARVIIEKLRAITPQPVRYLVNTHWHDDHIWGNQEFADAFPGVAIIGHRKMRREMLERAIPGLAENLGRVAERIDERDAQLASGTEEDGTALTAERRQAIEKRQVAFRALHEDLKTIRPEPPSLTFTDRLVIHLGETVVEVAHLGAGHTSGDAIVHVPAAGVLITGDLLTHPIPATAEAFVSDWVDTLENLERLEARVLIPGHGPVLNGDDYLTLVKTAFASLLEQVRAGVREGLTLEEVAAAVDLSALRQRFVEGDPVLERAFERFFLGPAVESLYAELIESGGD